MTDQITVSRELLRQVLDFCEIEPNNEKAMAAYDALRTALERPQDFQSAVKKRPAEADYNSHVAYTRALEAYCDSLEQPVQEPVAFGRWHEDGYMDMVFLDEKECREYLNDDENPVALYTAPQAQQPPRIGTGTSVEQTLGQWEHDFRNPMTPEQQADWVKREREFAARQAQQPLCPCKDRPADQCDDEWGPDCDLGNNEAHCKPAQQPQLLTDEEILEAEPKVCDPSSFAAVKVKFARAIEQAALKRMGWLYETGSC